MLPPEEIISILQLEDLLEDLERKCDFEERICITLSAFEQVLPLKIDYEKKDSEESHKLKNQADELFFKEKGRSSALVESWRLYCKSIAKAEPSSVLLAQSYANRSAILFQLCKYAECINDIDKALKLQYPDQLRVNLLRRKAKCLKLLDNMEAETICEEARCCLENTNLNDNQKEKLKKKINKAIRVSKFPNVDYNKTKEIIIPEIIANKYIPSASDSVTMKFNKDLGKHLVANRDIMAGEILINEIPYASYISPEKIYTHCSHCLVRAWDSIPCGNCACAMYCSEKCKIEAWNQYHDIECYVKPSCLEMRMNELAPFSLKLIIMAVREAGSIKKLKELVEGVDYCKDFINKSLSEGDIYHSDRYKTIYCLLSHENSRKRYETLTVSLNAAFSLYFLFTLTSFFGSNLDKEMSTLCKSEEAMFIGKLIAQHYMIIQINDHEFNEVYDDEYIRVGSVLGPVTSLINHSCNPNVARCPVLRNNTIQQIIFALQPIKRGSEILDDYGCNFAFTPKAERESFCDKYFFKCNCIACTEMWPLFEDLPSILTIVNNKEDKIDVTRAIVRSKGHKRSVFDVGLNKYPGNVKDILVCLAISINTLSKSTSKPNKEYSELLEQFRQTFIEIYGNKARIV